MKKVLIMIDSFKSTITSVDAGKMMADILSKSKIETSYYPISDGGEGFYDAIKPHLKLKKIPITITDLDLTKKETFYYLDKKNAYIEVSEYIGFKGFNKGKNPLAFTSKAIGEIIKDIHQRNIKNIIIGLGGTLTNDFGLGILEELGVKFYGDKELKNLTINNLLKVSSVDVSSLEKYRDLKFTILSDVFSPLFGDNGATYTFGIQKGLKESELNFVEKSGIHLYNLLIKAGLKDTKNLPGAGAAGGLGNIILSIFNSEIKQGLSYVLDLIGFDNLVKDYDLIITGEGKIDAQSLQGKVVFEIAKRTNKPVILVCGISTIKLEEARKYHKNIKEIYAVVPQIANLEDSLNNPKENFIKLCYKVLDMLKYRW